ncbi:Triacylglycerol esterase/lipase EstA, alpha/beta hydrolase fold [Geodermatophilus pulveris]|uniref:Triacylglycerol esterase/lipase EstA, alpha/beta hydrolase fold n=1 Tax=Geodermatophilus pulveris TaxID=1564159 RepID=A0A239EPI1_9ACTN|nr:alpha/beta fold hydrolase [Geodermatophilus pulveris]SNS46148.1 Triacylglycerol esterase/lipase EstA, alpha/beta hydrolase fold [Geodermatophilus pulveris]
MLAGLSPARRRLVAALLALVAAAVLAGGAAWLLGRPAVGAGAPVAQERPGPVLLVPGYGGSTAALRPLADRLAALGRDTAVVEVPGNGTGDLAAAADALAEAAEAALERTGAGSVDVVGYSAGGVVARLWAADGGADVARRIVTLGSPHHGTALADLAGRLAPEQCADACRQLATGSPLLAELNAGDETPEGPAWVSIWTAQDQTVTPPESARLDGALELPVQSVCAQARVGHGELPRDPLVQAMVLEQLGAAPPAALGPDDCARLSSG